MLSIDCTVQEAWLLLLLLPPLLLVLVLRCCWYWCCCNSTGFEQKGTDETAATPYDEIVYWYNV